MAGAERTGEGARIIPEGKNGFQRERNIIRFLRKFHDRRKQEDGFGADYKPR